MFWVPIDCYFCLFLDFGKDKREGRKYHYMARGQGINKFIFEGFLPLNFVEFFLKEKLKHDLWIDAVVIKLSCPDSVYTLEFAFEWSYGYLSKINCTLMFPHTQRCGLNSNFRDIIDLEKAHGDSNWLNRWMEESLWNDRRDMSLRNGHGDDEKIDKILEVDTWKPRLNSQQSNRTFQAPQHVFAYDSNKEKFMSYESPSKHSTKAPNPVPIQATLSSKEFSSLSSLKIEDEAAIKTAENSPQVYSASSRPGSSARRGAFSPTRSERAWGFYSGYSGHPNYMANTESSRAKVRSQSAPRQRLEFENFGSTRRSAQGFRDAGIFSQQADYRNKAYPASSGLNRLGSSNLRWCCVFHNLCAVCGNNNYSCNYLIVIVMSVLAQLNLLDDECC